MSNTTIQVSITDVPTVMTYKVLRSRERYGLQVSVKPNNAQHDQCSPEVHIRPVLTRQAGRPAFTPRIGGASGTSMKRANTNTKTNKRSTSVIIGGFDLVPCCQHPGVWGWQTSVFINLKGDVTIFHMEPVSSASRAMKPDRISVVSTTKGWPL